MCLESIGRGMVCGITDIQPSEIQPGLPPHPVTAHWHSSVKQCPWVSLSWWWRLKTHTQGWDLPSMADSFKSVARGTHLNSFFLWLSHTCCHSSACQAGGQSIWLQACKEWGFGSLHWWAAGADAPGCWQDTSLVWIPTPQDAEQRLQGPLCHLSQKQPKTHL